jgi:hypothetical protein
MANVNGTNYAKFISPTPGNQMGAEWDGRMIVETESVNANNRAQNDTVNIGVLRAGEVFVTGWIKGANLGASTTVAVGDAGDAARYLAATNSNAAFSAQMIEIGANKGVGYKNNGTTDVPIFVTIGGGVANNAFQAVIVKARN